MYGAMGMIGNAAGARAVQSGVLICWRHLMTETELPTVLPAVTTEVTPPAPAPARGRRGGGGNNGGNRGAGTRRGGNRRAQAAGQDDAITQDRRTPASGRPQARAARKPQPARPANPILERLFELYPAMFGAHFLPLKLGVYQELMAAHGDEFRKEDLKLALGQHARSTRYLESVAAGEMRHDLQGVPVEPVAPEHIHHAILEVYRRRQARSKDDLRPWLRARLAAAVEASGLTREAWDERVGATDDLSVQALDDAFCDVAASVARREALKRAYEASGLSSMAEFADMYGMDPGVVEQALASRPGPKG